MANLLLADWLYTDAGVAISGATVDLFARNTTTPVVDTTTTSATGYWAFSVATEGRYDVRVTNGSSIRWYKYDVRLQLDTLEVANFNIRNPADTFDYDIVPAAITADRQLNIPLITGTDTLATLGLAQTWTAVQTLTSPVINTQITGTAVGTGASQVAAGDHTHGASATADMKDSVLVATTANITLSGEQTLDGVLTSASRVLVKNQTAGAENGIYVSAAGAWARAADANVSAEVTSGMFVPVSQGTVGADTVWSLTTNDPIVLGTDALVFTAVAAALSAAVRDFLATPSSANLAALVTDETGSGLLVFGTSPTLITPALGTPASGLMTNVTGLPVAGIVASTVTALGVGSIELGHATDTTLTRTGAGDIAIEGNAVYRAGGTDVPVADGGTGASTLTGIVIGAGTVALTALALTASQSIRMNAGGTAYEGYTPAGSGASAALSNLASVAINTALLDDVAAADDFGSATLPWKDIFLAGSSGTPGTNNFRITGASTSGTRVITIPDRSMTLADIAAAQTFTGVQTFTSPVINTGATGTGIGTAAGTLAAGDHTHAGGSSGVTRAGGNTTEATTTSSSIVSLITVSSLSIAVGTPVLAIASFRKTTGAAEWIATGVKLNTTAVGSVLVATVGANAAGAGRIETQFTYGTANYLRSGYQHTESDGFVAAFIAFDTDMPTATLTDVIFQGRTQAAGITMGIDDMQVYTYAVS